MSDLRKAEWTCICRIREYDDLLDGARHLQDRLECLFNAMNSFELSALDSRVFNGLASAQHGLEAVIFCIRECQLADESKIDNKSEVPADE